MNKQREKITCSWCGRTDGEVYAAPDFPFERMWEHTNCLRTSCPARELLPPEVLARAEDERFGACVVMGIADAVLLGLILWMAW